MEFGGRGFKSHSGQLSIATSNNPSVVNTIYTYIHIYRSREETLVIRLLSTVNKDSVEEPKDFSKDIGT